MTTRSVADLTLELRNRADARGMEVRHPDTDLYRHLTQSLRSVRNLVTRSGGDIFLEGTAALALPTTPPTTGETYLEIAWPTGATSIHGIDVYTGTKWYPLDGPVQWAARRDYQNSSGPPRAFSLRTIPKEASTPTTSLAAGAIQIHPLSTMGLTHRVWYLPELAELDNPNHLVNGWDGDWLEWALWDSTIKICAEDDDVQNVDAIAIRERSIVQDRIVANLQRVQHTAPIQPRRARGY